MTISEFPTSGESFPVAKANIPAFPGPVSTGPPPAHNASILMETGSYLLLETGDTILLEA